MPNIRDYVSEALDALREHGLRTEPTGQGGRL